MGIDRAALSSLSDTSPRERPPLRMALIPGKYRSVIIQVRPGVQARESQGRLRARHEQDRTRAHRVPAPRSAAIFPFARSRVATRVAMRKNWSVARWSSATRPGGRADRPLTAVYAIDANFLRAPVFPTGLLLDAGTSSRRRAASSTAPSPSRCRRLACSRSPPRSSPPRAPKASP
jgi:hypothetical protein